MEKTATHRLHVLAGSVEVGIQFYDEIVDGLKKASFSDIELADFFLWAKKKVKNESITSFPTKIGGPMIRLLKFLEGSRKLSR